MHLKTTMIQMKQFFTRFFMAVVLVMSTLSLNAQQLPDPGFEDWSGAKFDGNIQPKYWHGSNVSQVGFNFNFTTRETGRSGYCVKVANTYCGAMGIGQVSPGYVTIGTPWQYISGMDKANATGGTDGGINFTYRPDSMYVWIKRTGNKATTENFSVLFYSWKGNSSASSYKANENNNCTNTGAHTNEESDIRQAMDANKCGTATKATQVAEGFLFDMKEYTNWTQIKVPIYYFNDEAPEKANVILSSSGYPNFRQSGNINEGNAIYADDIALVYSSKIQQLYIGGKLWNGFDPNSTAEQVYSVGRTTTVPEVYAVRGAGTIKNIAGTTVNVPGRRLSGSEINIQYGTVDGAPTVITVTAADNSSTTTYRIKMVQAPSDNAKLGGIQVNGEPISGYNPMVGTYNVSLPYGTTAAPVVTVTKGEDGQNVTITQATSTTGTATINVVAPDGTTTKTYTINFSVALLSDNTLAGIKVNGQAIMDFTPTLTTYRVELPLGTTTMPTVEAVSAYPPGEQTIQYTAPATIDNGQYKISVTTPGNPTAKVYKLNFKITASTNSKLADLKMGSYIEDFNPSRTTYYVTLPMGTTELPAITYTKGDNYQTVTIQEGGVDGTTTITVVAASGDQTVYKIICSTEKSEVSHLSNIFIDGVALEGFDPNVTSYTYNLPIGTTALPAITWEAADEFETITPIYGGLNGTTRITVTAGNGNTTIYKITFSLETSSNATLNAIYVGGQLLEGFDPNTFIYLINLPKGTTELPAITWTQHDEWQTVTARYGGVNGDTKLTVRPQTGASQTYTLQFRVQMDTVNHLQMIYLNGERLQGFHPDTLRYIDSLPVGVSAIPTITYTQASQSENVKVLNAGNVRTIRVTAENGSVREYVITFVITKLESAFPKMIYVDGKPLEGFDKTELNYIYEFEGETAPVITVEKDGNQQVTILTPVLEGTATVIVRPEGGGEGNTYTILFRLKTSEDVMLEDILLDGRSLRGFQGSVLDYTVSYTDVIPEVSYVAQNGQKVTVLTEKNVVRLYVAANGKSATYTLAFVKQLSADVTLQAILLDSVPMAQFVPETYDYALTLPAGSHVPDIAYIKGNEAQMVYMGQTGANRFAIQVIAEDGTMATYTLDFTIEQYTSTALLGIALDGTSLELQEGVYDYTQTIYEGAALPELTYTTDNGQTALAVNTSSTEQKVIVTAENGDVATYTISYTVVRSDDALLSGILLNGEALEGFAADVHAYTVELPWRTTIVPVIQPVSATPGQTVTIDYGAVNATTNIHVVAADGIAESNYTIAFPVHKSDNTKLETVEFEDVTFDFSPETNDYVIDLPYQTKAVPTIAYFAQEPEQHIEYISAPIADTTKLIVTAENGDQRTYTFAFNVPQSDKTNVLRQLIISTNKQSEMVRDVAADETDITVSLPYGTNEFNVSYLKSYDEQTVLVQPGGIYNATILTVKANRGDEEDVVYTVTPKIEQQNPAVLESITISGNPLPGFDKNRFSYIAKVSSSPLVSYTFGTGVAVMVTVSTSKHWQATATKDGYTNTYDVWFYYPSDVIPNSDFTQWTSAATTSSAKKPTGWNCLADFASSYTYAVAFTFTPGEEVQQDGSNSVVYLHTQYNAAPLAGYVPGYITLGDIEYHYQRWGSSAFSVSGGIDFRNSPDVFSVRYKLTTANNNNRILYTMTGTHGTKTETLEDSQTSSNYVTKNIDLTNLNAAVGDPTQLNIVLNSFDSESGKNGTAGGEAKMYVDWVKISYNSSLSKVLVNGEAATKKDDKTFTYTLPSSEDKSQPELTFIGEVSDQAQIVTWTPENKGKRIAVVRNFAEDSVTYTQYNIEITRPLSTVNTLAALEVNGLPVDEWNAEKTDYTVYVPFGQKRIYDVQAKHGSNLQTVTTSQNGNVVTVSVKPESGATRTYTVTFVESKSDDVTLAGLSATGVEYNPAITEYNVSASTLPDIRFIKQTDGQTVVLRNGQLFITAENGINRDTITITNTPPVVTTSGQLLDLSLDGNTVEGFNPNVFDYYKPQPALTSFIREYDSDVVRQTITPDSITWQVTGSSEHTYSLVYPNDLSSDIALDTIYINGRPLEGFNAAETEYTIYNNEPISIDIRTKPGQSVTVNIQVQAMNSNAAGRMLAPVQHSGLRYTIDLVAEDGVSRERYIIDVLPEVSSDATLKMIRLDGVDLAGFTADNLRYQVELPSANPKLQEPSMPSITYLANHPAQTITVDTAHIGGTTYINVTSEDGMLQNSYELVVTAEPSHNADLNGLMLNGELLDNFSANRHFYSAQVENMNVQVTYSSVDRFQDVTTIYDGNTVTVRVTAQDSVTVNDYIIELYTRSLSADVTLANILLNGQSFTDYDASLVPFTPMNSYYTIPVLNRQPVPDVSATLNSIGQTMEIIQREDSVFITVTAEDGVHTNTYVLYFRHQYSDDTSLAKLEVGDSVLTLVPGQTAYRYVLPVGTDEHPVVFYELADFEAQREENEQDSKTLWSMDVVAENGTRVTYSIEFVYTLSPNALLSDITADGTTIPGFRADSMYYAYVLPMGVRTVPELQFEKGDQWQYDPVVTLITTDYRTTCQCTVLAEDSIHSKTYTVVYEIQKSDVDTLAVLSVANGLLKDFDPHVTSYVITLPKGTTEIPAVECEKGDPYQDTISSIVGNVYTMMVIAENGQQRTYTITFNKALSDDATLLAIYCAGEPLEGFEPETENYTIKLPYGTTSIPVVTYIKNNTKQQDVMSVFGDQVAIIVTAEDGTVRNYMLTFVFAKSPEARLASITVGGEPLVNFDPEIREYTVFLPYGTTELPEVNAILADSTATKEIVANGLSVVISTTSADEEHFDEYTVLFQIERCEIDWLTDLQVKGTTIEGFDKDTLVYSIEYPQGTDSTAFVTAKDVTWTLADTTETVTVNEQKGVIEIMVVAQNDKYVRVYVITQTILLNSNSRLADLTVNGKTVKLFADSVYNYSYTILEGETLPEVKAVAQDSLAEVSVSYGADYAKVFCTAQDGSETVYTVLFEASALNTGATPQTTDVLIKQLSNDQFAAYSIRLNTYLAIYDDKGHIYYNLELPVCNPNDAVISTDTYGREVLTDATGDAAYFQLPSHGQTIFYLFYSDNQRIESGKFIVQ